MSYKIGLYMFIINFLIGVLCCEHQTRQVEEMQTHYLPNEMSDFFNQINKMIGMNILPTKSNNDGLYNIHRANKIPDPKSIHDVDNIPCAQSSSISRDSKIPDGKTCYMTNIEDKYHKTKYQISLTDPIIYITKYEHKTSGDIILMLEVNEVLVSMCYTENQTKRTTFMYENGKMNPTYYTKHLEDYDLNNNAFAKHDLLKGFHIHVTKNNKEDLRLHAIKLLKENKIDEASTLLSQIKA